MSAASATAVWALLLALLAGRYAYRLEAAQSIGRMTQERAPSEVDRQPQARR
jgi:hypothetical protein